MRKSGTCAPWARHLARRALYSSPYRRAIIGRKRNMYLPIKDVGRLTCAEYNGMYLVPIILTGATPFASERTNAMLNFISASRGAKFSEIALHRMFPHNRGICRVKQHFRMMYIHAARPHNPSARISLFRSRMHSAKYAIIQCAKGPFASDSISMNVVLSSNTAYRDQFSGRTRFSSPPWKSEGKKRKEDDILFPCYPRVARSLKSVRLYTKNMSSFKMFSSFCLRRFFRPP